MEKKLIRTHRDLDVYQKRFDRSVPTLLKFDESDAMKLHSLAN